MRIISGIMIAAIIWWILKLSLYTLIVFAVIGAILGALTRYIGRKAK